MKKPLKLTPPSMGGEVGTKAPVRWRVSALSVVLVLITGTVVGTNLVTADPGPGASPITVTFNYNGATGGNTRVSETVTPGVSADSFLPLPFKSGLNFTGWFNSQSLLNGQRITTIGQGDAGQLQAGYVPGELAAALNLDLPPPPPTCAAGGPCVLGNIGPGGGLVFYDAGSPQTWGRYLEMAPKNWNDPTNVSAVDPTIAWCNNTTTALAGTFDTQIGTGAQNTVLMDAGCTSGAGQSAADYVGGGKSDWFLPSLDELNAMCNYSRTWTDTPSTGLCRIGSQKGAFAIGPYGFASDYSDSDYYWSSSQYDSFGGYAWVRNLNVGNQGVDFKSLTLRVRPIRAF